MHAARGFVCWLLGAGILAWAALWPAQASALTGNWPVSGPILRGFDPPEVTWAAGHRGVDVGGRPGESVASPADGVVSFVGVIAGRPVVVVTHGDVRTTLEPVEPAVAVGTRVVAGETVGRLVAGHEGCPAAACLHWGLKRGEQYLDPLSSVGRAPRLLPASASDAVAERARQREAALASLGPGVFAPSGSGVLGVPSAGRVTSVFGPRLHPIFHEWRLHSGLDLSAPCGTPLHAAADGVVAHRGFDASGGWRLIIDHGTLGGAHLQSVYLHAEGYRVAVGQRVSRGEVVGSMGTTGWSTGCHLHFSVKANGRLTDPKPWLG